MPIQKKNDTGNGTEKAGKVTDQGYVIRDYNEDIVVKDDTEEEFKEDTPVSSPSGRQDRNIYRDIKNEPLKPPAPPVW